MAKPKVPALELSKRLCMCCLLLEHNYPGEGMWLSPNSALCLTLPEDRFPPSIITNKGLVLDENSAKTISTLQLSAADQDSETSQLQYKVTRQPQLGHLEHVASPGEQGGAGPSEQQNTGGFWALNIHCRKNVPRGSSTEFRFLLEIKGLLAQRVGE